MKVIINKSILNSFNFLEAETIEKAKKGEMLGGEYIYRENIAEKETASGVRRYRYYWLKDFLADPAEKLLSKLGKFFFKKNPDQIKKIDKSYDELNIKKDFNADKKTYFQHVMEYFSHRKVWDKRFADKKNAKKEPIIMEASEVVEVEGMEAPVEKAPEAQPKEPKQPKEKAPKQEKKWKPNPSLMYRIWEQYTGKTAEKEEKQTVEAEKKISNVIQTTPEMFGIKEPESEKHINRSRAMMGNDNAKKEGVNNGENNTDIKQDGISGGNQDLWESIGTNSNEVMSGPESGSNNSELLYSADESGIRPSEPATIDYGLITDTAGNGRITAGKARKIREACRQILATKTDDQMTEQDKALLAQYVGAGGTGEEGASNSGLLYEFYTPRTVINKCWQLMDKWLPNKKTCIEPSSGIGRFVEGRSEQFTMFEYEKDSSRIAKILHPEAEVVQGEFEKNWLKQYNGRFSGKNFQKFDCAVGNPPYGEMTGFFAKTEGKDYSRYEDYFISRTLDAMKDNGVMVMVLPSGFLTNDDPKTRKEKEIIAKKGKLLEAWRLPDGTFDTTSQGTDIVVIRKEPGDYNDFVGDNYFKNNPTHVCGDYDERPTKWGMKRYVKPRNGEDFETAVTNIDINNIEAVIKELPKAETIIEAGPSEETKRKISEGLKGNKNAKGKHFVQSTGKNMTAEEFNQRYGIVTSREDLEIWKYTDYNGNIDTSVLTDAQKEYIEKSDNYVKEGNQYTNVVNYASGNIREKLDELEIEYKGNEITQKDYEFKKSILESALPKEKEIGEFTLSPIADWTRKYVTKEGVGLIQGFYDWAFNGRVDLSNPELPLDSPIAQEDIPPEISFSDIIGYLDKTIVRSSMKDGEDTKARARVKFRRAEKRRDTAEALFNRYLKEGLSKEDQEELKKRWNDNFNAYRNPDYSKIPFFIDGMNENKGTKEFILTKQQLKGISFLTNKGSGLLAYDVGVGKTVTGLCATVNQLQTGRSKRPLICVPNAVYEKWITEIHQHFPDLELNELRNFSKDHIEHGWKPKEGTLSICTYEALEKISFSESVMNEIHEDVEFTRLQKTEGDKEKSKRQIAKESEKVNETVGNMVKTSDEAFNFDELGFDHITVDEVHNFKNIFTTPRNVQVTTEGEPVKEANEFQSLGGATSDRGQKLFAITQYIQRHNDNRNVFGLSATPFQNSPIEVYNILSLFARKRMKDLGIYSLEEFVKQFAKLKAEYAVTATTIKEKMVMKSFNNLTALQNLITEYIDKVDGGEAHVIRPMKRTHLPQLKMTDLQHQIMEAETAYIEMQQELPKADRDPGSTLSSLNAMRMATLSPSLIPEGRYELYQQLGFNIQRPADKDFIANSPKLKFVCDSVIEQYKKAPSEGQVVYMPRGVEQYPQMVEYLVQNGIPADAITTMAGGGSEKELQQREVKINEFNDSEKKCKIIIGSETIKEGVSLNGNATTLYNTMLGWNPTETQQVEGRIWRQGNKQGITHIVYPLLQDSLDAMMYQKYNEKTDRLNNLFSYKGDTMNVDDIDAEELKFALIKDPAKRADLQTRQYKEKAEDNIKLYEQMIDVLGRQSKIAFGNLEEIPAYSMVTDRLEKEQKLYDTYKMGLKQWESRLKQNPDDSNAQRQVINVSDFLTKQKAKMDEMKRELKRMETTQKNMQELLAKRGMKNHDDVEKKHNELNELRKKAIFESSKADEMREDFYKQAVLDNLNNNSDTPDIAEAVKIQVDSIRNDLHPMDEEWKSKIEAMNNSISKSLPLFMIKAGRFLVRIK